MVEWTTQNAEVNSLTSRMTITYFYAVEGKANGLTSYMKITYLYAVEGYSKLKIQFNSDENTIS